MRIALTLIMIAGCGSSVAAGRVEPGSGVQPAAIDSTPRAAEPESGAVTGEPVATREAPEPPPAEPVVLPVASLGPPAGDGAAIDRWIAERVAHARAGHREWVRVALVFASDGWGCVCPSHYIGDSPVTNSGHDNWIHVDLADGLAFPEPPYEQIDETTRSSQGMVVRVDGYFTGEMVEEDHREPDGEPAEWLYRLAVLHVTRVDRAIPEERAERFRVALLEPPPATP